MRYMELKTTAEAPHAKAVVRFPEEALHIAGQTETDRHSLAEALLPEEALRIAGQTAVGRHSLAAIMFPEAALRFAARAAAAIQLVSRVDSLHSEKIRIRAPENYQDYQQEHRERIYRAILCCICHY